VDESTSWSQGINAKSIATLTFEDKGLAAELVEDARHRVLIFTLESRDKTVNERSPVKVSSRVGQDATAWNELEPLEYVVELVCPGILVLFDGSEVGGYLAELVIDLKFLVVVSEVKNLLGKIVREAGRIIDVCQ
jgi:hypothetical protein